MQREIFGNFLQTLFGYKRNVNFVTYD